MDTSDIQARIAQLKTGDLQRRSFFLDTYGLSEKGFNTVERAVRLWAQREAASAFQQGQLYSRWTFERYYAAFGLLPPRAAAYRLGITPDSLPELLSYVQSKLGTPKETLGTFEASVPEEFIKTLYKHFPSLRTKVFSSHSSYCKALHQVLKQDKVKFEPAYDPTSKLLDKGNPDLSRNFDAVTLGPLGTRYGVWLNTGKPIALEPDKTSAVNYVDFEELLEPLIPSYRPLDTTLLLQVRRARNA